MENLLELSKKINVQIYPSKVRVIPNDIISKKFFNLSYLNFANLLSGFTGNIAEKQNHKKVGDIFSTFKVQVADGFTVSEPFDMYDCAVLSVCISEWMEGNRYTTPSIIYRGLSGKVGESDANPSKAQLAEIVKSIEKLMRIQGQFDLSAICENLGYNAGHAKRFVSNILPGQLLEKTTINGKVSGVIQLTAEPPLLSIAKLKNNQLLTFEAKLLNIPHQQNTRLNVMVKTYAMIRIMEIKLHRLTPTITFQDLFKKCRIEQADKKIKQRARESLLAFLEHVKTCKIIKNYTLSKLGNCFQSVNVSYSSCSQKS